MATRMPKAINVLRFEGRNGYALELHDHGDAGMSAVVVGTATGKRHANVVLDWADAEEIVDRLRAIYDPDLEDYDGPGLTTIEPKEQYL